MTESNQWSLKSLDNKLAITSVEKESFNNYCPTVHQCQLQTCLGFG
jgi:hypothetical protein